MAQKLFGTSGIRGFVDIFFTEQFCFDIGRTFGIFLDRHAHSGLVAVGMDPRESSPRIMKYVIKGLVFEKKKILDEGITPVPAMNLILNDSEVIGSAMITGSHIKSDMNGIKFFCDKAEILKKDEAEIEEIYDELKGKIAVESFEPDSRLIAKDNRAIRTYQDILVSMVKMTPIDLKILVDAGNGSQSEVFPKTLKKIGILVEKINCDLTQKLIFRDTETNEAADTLKREVVLRKCDLGVAFDPDGDRAIFVDEQGNFIPGDFSSALLAKHIPGEVIVTTINTSQVVEKIGKKVIRTKVGSPYVVQAMIENHAVFGFEANGGCIFPNVMLSRDGGTTAIKIIDLIFNTKKPLSELLKELPRYYLYRTKVKCPTEKNNAVLSLAKERYQSYRIEGLDGLKIWLSESSWILFRPSANAPEFRVFAEAETQEEADKIGEKGIELVKEVINDKKV